MVNYMFIMAKVIHIIRLPCNFIKNLTLISKFMTFCKKQNSATVIADRKLWLNKINSLPLHYSQKKEQILFMNKTVILFIILAIIVVGYLLFISRKKNDAPQEEHHDVEGGCCGRHAVCEKGLDNASLYFDDEELDAFKGRRPEDYTDKEVEEFRNVLYTMKSEEVDEWVQCLQQRGIEIPYEIKDEILLILQ